MAWLKEGIAAGDFKLENGWAFSTKVGTYGTNYIQRALVTAIGLGANRPQDAIYPTSTGPDLVKKYDGSKKYVMRFEKGQTPPVEGFWSLTLYDNQPCSMLATPQNYPRAAAARATPRPRRRPLPTTRPRWTSARSRRPACRAAIGSRPCRARAGSRSCASMARWSPSSRRRGGLSRSKR